MENDSWLKSGQAEDALRQSLALRWWQLRFVPEIEARFEGQLRQVQAQHFFQNAALALLLYNLFALSDRYFLPDVYQIAWLIRFGVVSPLLLLVLAFIRKPFLEKYRETIMAGLVLLTAAGMLYPYALSQYPQATHAHWGMLIIMLFSNLMVHFRFSYALGISICLLMLYAVALLIKEPPQVVLFVLVIALSITLLGLITNFRQEKDWRRGFVMLSLLSLGQYRQAEANERLEDMVDQDPLTGLPNRRRFDVEYPRIWKDAVRQGKPLSLLFVDIDYFKNYNDAYGHAQGDICLRTVAALLADAAAKRPLDMAIRNGGEEFVILLPETSPQAAEKIAELFRSRLEGLAIPHRASELERVTASVGVAGGYPQADSKSADYLESADKAMYRAKRHGRNRVELIQL